MNIVKLRSPWVLLQRKLWALFRGDAGVEVDLDESQSVKVFTLRVESARKADALARLMPAEIEFGNVKAVVRIVPANAVGKALPPDAPAIEVVKAAFEGNDAVNEIRPVSKGLFRDLCYVVFRNEVVQYEADNLMDVNGNVSTVMEEIAREVLTKAEGVFFCTSAATGDANKLDKPLGEWP